MSDLRLSTNIV